MSRVATFGLYFGACVIGQARVNEEKGVHALVHLIEQKQKIKIRFRFSDRPLHFQDVDIFFFYIQEAYHITLSLLSAPTVSFSSHMCSRSFL